MGDRPGPSAPSISASRSGTATSQMSRLSPAGVIAHVSNPASPRRASASGHWPSGTLQLGRNRISPMLTRTVRRVYGSMQVGSSTNASIPKARAERATAPRFSGSLRPSRTATRRWPAITSSSVGCARRSAAAIAPRCRSNPTMSCSSCLSTTYTGVSSGSSRSAIRAYFCCDTSTERTVWGEAISRSIATGPSAMKNSSPSIRRRAVALLSWR